MLRIVLFAVLLLALTYNASAQCTAATCQNQGVCVIVIGQASCACPVGYQGMACETATATTTVTPVMTVTMPPTSAPGSGSCPAPTTNHFNLGCGQKEIVFMIEYARGDTADDIDHEGDFIKRLVQQWNVNDQNIRVGVVVYHDTVQEVIHIDDFPNDPRTLSGRIGDLTKNLQPSGTNDLAVALDYVRTHSFTNARPGVERVVVPIVHMMPDSTKAKITASAQALKDTCVTLLGLGVSGTRFQTGATSSLDAALMQSAMTQPGDVHFDQYNSFDALEEASKSNFYDDVGCP